MKQTTPTIGILGAGAVGSYLVMGLSEKYKENLWVIADGERKKRLEENGLNINDQHYILNIPSFVLPFRISKPLQISTRRSSAC